MPITTIIYIVLAVLVSVAIAYFQYFFKTKKNPKITVLLFFLRALSLFLRKFPLKKLFTLQLRQALGILLLNRVIMLIQIS